jgi:hypothetical protein
VIEGNNEKYISLGTPADGENYKVTNPPSEVKKLQSGSGFINMVPEPTFFVSGNRFQGKGDIFFQLVKVSKLCFNSLHMFLYICFQYGILIIFEPPQDRFLK